MHVAGLARLELSEEEVELFTGAAAHRARARGATWPRSTSPTCEPSSHPIALRNVLRADEPRPSLDRAEVLAVAPAVEDHRFRVPRIGGEAP